ncbi:MAG: hypothetical protein ACWA5L_03735 [bacterium]
MNSGKKTIFLTSTAIAALALAAFGSVFAQTLRRSDDSSNPKDHKGPVIEGTYQVIDDDVETQVPPSPLATQSGRRIAAGVAVTGLLSSLIALFGPNKILHYIVALGRKTRKAAAHTARGAKSAAIKVADTIKSPGRALILIAGLSIFALTGVALLDIQWKAGLVVGASMAAVAGYGFHKSGKALRGWMQNMPDPRQFWTAKAPQSTASA